jgi:hypothetical protein
MSNGETKRNGLSKETLEKLAHEFDRNVGKPRMVAAFIDKHGDEVVVSTTLSASEETNLELLPPEEVDK